MRLMDLDSYSASRKTSRETAPVSRSEPTTVAIQDKNEPKGAYRPLQIQELLDLVIEQGMSARQAGLTVGIVVTTAQHYVKQYKDDDEKRLHTGFQKSSTLWRKQ
ncbi:hypothetical protein BD770DRAFT_415580 [Pilaira anomala]|nr:hypothetical protein BD770DRAFT_415580 [Pilaira anomala]